MQPVPRAGKGIVWDFAHEPVIANATQAEYGATQRGQMGRMRPEQVQVKP